MGSFIGVFAAVGSAVPTAFYLCCCTKGDFPAQPNDKPWKIALGIGAALAGLALAFAKPLEVGGALMAAFGGNFLAWGAYGVAEAQNPADDNGKSKRRGAALATVLLGFVLLALCYAEDLNFRTKDVFHTREMGINVCALGGGLFGTGAPLACAAPGRPKAGGGKHDPAAVAAAPED